MNRQKFDVLWKIGIMIILLVSIFFVFRQLKEMNMDGLACQSNPFVYGQQKAEEQDIYCYYQCFDKETSSIFFKLNMTMKLNLTGNYS